MLDTQKELAAAETEERLHRVVEALDLGQGYAESLRRTALAIWGWGLLGLGVAGIVIAGVYWVSGWISRIGLPGLTR